MGLAVVILGRVRRLLRAHALHGTLDRLAHLLTARSAFTALRATVYATAFIALWGYLAYRAHLLDTRLGLYGPAWVPQAGIALIVLGLALALACVATFVARGRGTPAPFDAPREFVASGPYRWVRNPMYIGGFLALAGYALCAGSFAALGLAFLFLALFHAFVVLYEEPTLATRFGASYAEYRRRVPRWIPRRPR